MLSLTFFDLTEIELDGRRTTQYLYRNLQTTLFVVDLLNDSVEVIERPVNNAHDLARLEQHFRPWLVDAFLDALQDLVGFLVNAGHAHATPQRVRYRIRCADESWRWVETTSRASVTPRGSS